jgi:hypothetical protein
MVTATEAAKSLRATIKDYNYWGQSESDSPLKISRTKTPIDINRIIVLDERLRAKVLNLSTRDYDAPERNVRVEQLDTVFTPLVQNALTELKTVSDELDAGNVGIGSLVTPAESLEFYAQIYATFQELETPSVYYVEDTENDPYTGLFIVGKSGQEYVYASTLLVQT